MNPESQPNANIIETPKGPETMAGVKLVERLNENNIEPTEVAEEEFFYDYLSNKNQQFEIYRFTKQAVEYFESIDEPCSIVFIDRSARPVWVAIDELWNLKHQKDKDLALKKPKFYFLNPDGFKTENRFGLGYNAIRTEEEVLSELKDRARVMLEDKDRPLILLDTCRHLGITIDNMRWFLKQVGFDDVRIIIVNENENMSGEDSVLKTPRSGFRCSIFNHALGDHSGDLIKKQMIRYFPQKFLMVVKKNTKPKRLEVKRK
ncbi:MAG: hypothetical protein WCO09_02825 [bacterium]